MDRPCVTPSFGDRGRLAIPAHRRLREGFGAARRDECRGIAGPVRGSGRWTDIQRRADDLTQELYSLREAVPDDGDRARIADTLVSLQAARSAMDAERAPGGPDPRQAEVVRGRLDSFEMSLRALRAGDAEYR
jgi:hypothetical protein